MTSESHPVPFPHTKATEWQAPDEALDLTPLKTAEIVFLQTNKTNHAVYYMARDMQGIRVKMPGFPAFI